MLKEAPAEMHRLLEKLTRSVSSYLAAQIEAGAQVLQIFDTWGGILPAAEFGEFSLRYIEAIVRSLPTEPRAGHRVLQGLRPRRRRGSPATGCQAVGLDAATDIGSARGAVGSAVALQGNLEPALLRSEPGVFLAKAAEILSGYGAGDGHIFNLGHGILPDIPVEHVQELVRFVQT